MESRPPSDPDLVLGLHRRDRETLARVYSEYHSAVYNLCARILDDREEAKDMTQDVFLKAFDRPPAATSDVRLRPWLFRVATNTCLNRIRSRRRSGPMEMEEVAAGGDPYEQARTATLVGTSLAALNERYRAALVLKDLHGLETRELAEVLEVSRPAADVLVHRARAAFRTAFAATAGGDAAAPASLALALPALPVPAALQTLPLIPPATPAALDPSSAAHVPTGPLIAATGGGAAAAAPTGGLLSHLGATLGAKAAVVAAGAALVAGGGAAAVKLSRGEQHGPTPTVASPAAVHRSAPESRVNGAWSDDRRRHRHRVAARLAGDHAGHADSHESGNGLGNETHNAGAEGGHDERTQQTVTSDPAAHDSGDSPPSDTDTGGSHGGDEEGDHTVGDEH